ncbi:MAG: alpha-L-rhamnosidase-related protein [Bacilli bacterium]
MATESGIQLNLAPAKWIWLPSERTLANTVVLFRKTIELSGRPIRASGWIAVDSRYRLAVNGQRMQWGPAPSDPRWPEADPMDLTAVLHPGQNTVGVEVLYYGSGDGTWPLGKPGLLCRLDIETDDGQTHRVASDATWWTAIDRSHRPGQYRRWFLRALQEDVDLRLKPIGWDQSDFVMGSQWTPAMEIPGSDPSRPALVSSYSDYSWSVSAAQPSLTALRARSIPMLAETMVLTRDLVERGAVHWLRDPDDWFEFRMPNSFAIEPQQVDAAEPDPLEWTIEPTQNSREGQYLTFRFPAQVVGWPYIVLDAPAGATVELMWQEAHDPKHTHWLDSGFYGWDRFVCREGQNVLEPFDYESLRWLQIHVHNASRAVTVLTVGMRRRQFPWPHPAAIRMGDAALQRLMEAAVNTLHNSAQDIVVDGMARERQQYSGDGGHQLYAIRYTFGEVRLPARFLTTFSQGLTRDGYFLDSWPAFDRMARLMTHALDLADWGPILDHGVGFMWDCWHHYLETGDRESLREPYPRLKRFAAYLLALKQADGLLPVEDLGTPVVWLDHDAYIEQRHKQCAFNLYVAATFQYALSPMMFLFEEITEAERWAQLGKAIERAAVAGFWDPTSRTFVANQPWLAAESTPRWCDRSLATSVLFQQCPGNDIEPSIAILANRPPECGISYPCNAGWRYSALVQGGRADIVVRELREIWAQMPSVLDNNTIQENWTVRSDSVDLWSHSAVAPLNVFWRDLLGLRPVTAGFSEYQLTPHLADLGQLDATAHTPVGPLRVIVGDEDGEGRRHVAVTTPMNGRGSLWIPEEEARTVNAAVLDWNPVRQRVRVPLQPGREYHWSIPNDQ